MENRTVGVRELKARLSYYMHEVKAGHTITVTDRGQPVGYLVPAATELHARLQAIQNAGLLRWSGAKPKLGHPVGRLKPQIDLTQIISENRE